MIDLPTAGMEDWEFNQGFYYGLSQEDKEHIDALAGGTFFILNVEKARALFEKRSQEFFFKVFSMRQECHACCNKFSSRTGNLHLQVWRRSFSQT
jgi:hypothetical protein